MNVISSTGSSSGRKVDASSVLVNAGMRTRIISSGVSGSLGSSDDDRFADDEMAVIAAPPEVAMFSTAEEIAPAEIPPEPSGTEYVDDDDVELQDNDDLDNNHDRTQNTSNSHVSNQDDEDDDESEYEYEEDDDAAFSGFLMTGQTLQLATNAVPQRAAEPARIREDEDDEEVAMVDVAPMEQEQSPTNAEQSNQQPPASAGSRSPARKPKWREPSRDAVNMSLRAERETTGGKRRLAQDLYRIMNQDTEEAGFSLQPKSEDAMDKWTIKLFQFDEDSNLAKDMVVLGLDHVELEMSFPEHYPFDPPFVRVVRPRFKRQTGFVMNGALCMELLTKDGWNPVNDIESVIVSIRSLLVVGDGRLQHACDMPKANYESILAAARKAAPADEAKDATRKRQRSESGEQLSARMEKNDAEQEDEKESRASKKQEEEKKAPSTEPAGAYSMAEAMAAYTHLSDYHAKKGWDNSGWWSRKG